MIDIPPGDRLAGKVAIISGAARGMGAAEAALFAAQGAAIVATDLDAKDLDAVVGSILARGGRAVGIAADAANEQDWARVADAALTRFGRIDALVNNAGIHPLAVFEDIAVEEWDRVQAVNLRSVFLGTRAVLPAMKAQGKGAIVNIASIAAYLGDGLPHYSASKAGVTALTRVTAVRFGPSGVRANAILPGAIETDMIKPAIKHDAVRRQLEQATPLRTIGQCEDIAAMALFLASDEARFVSGGEFVVDGGFSVTNALGGAG